MSAPRKRQPDDEDFIGPMVLFGVSAISFLTGGALGLERWLGSWEHAWWVLMVLAAASAIAAVLWSSGISSR